MFYIIVILAAIFAMSAKADETLRDKVIGTWKLISWESVRSNGQTVNIWMGDRPAGSIVYLPNGYMAVQVMRDPRPILNDLTATADEFRKAYFGYYAYWGTYSINEAESAVEHKIQSSERSWEVGLTPKRAIRFVGTKLVLSTPAYKAGAFVPHDVLERAQVQDDEMLVNRLTWERLELPVSAQGVDPLCDVEAQP